MSTEEIIDLKDLQGSGETLSRLADMGAMAERVRSSSLAGDKAAAAKEFMQMLSASNINMNDLFKVYLPKSYHDLLEYSPSELYDILNSRSERQDAEPYETYKVRRRIKSKIAKKRDLLIELQLLPSSIEEYLESKRIGEEVVEAAKTLDSTKDEESAAADSEDIT